ncbi:hypothetical protein VNO77_42751 [Canavalia gladiata]|uniref:Uncharacterized protein n=1 Tax=Canavalia gladiata TaxID=3824 RepID=A0AAN9JV39_CANGL
MVVKKTRRWSLKEKISPIIRVEHGYSHLRFHFLRSKLMLYLMVFGEWINVIIKYIKFEIYWGNYASI